MSEMHERLQQARKHAGFESPSEAARALGIPEPTYLAHENGSRGFKRRADFYARRYRVNFEWLVTSKGQMTGSPSIALTVPKQPIIQVPLLDFVTAGRLAEPRSQIPVEDVPLLAFADLGRGEFFALRVDGTSMDRVSPDGSIIVVNKADKTLINGKCYVFTVRGETTYKMWQNQEVPHLAPFTYDPVHKPIFVKKKNFGVVGRVKRTVLDL